MEAYMQSNRQERPRRCYTLEGKYACTTRLGCVLARREDFESVVEERQQAAMRCFDYYRQARFL